MTTSDASGDSLLAPVFAGIAPDHVDHVARFVAEVLGGPKSYSRELGGHAAMVRRHMGRSLSEPQRQRWMQRRGAEAPGDGPMPAWNWGAVKGPYVK